MHCWISLTSIVLFLVLDEVEEAVGFDQNEISTILDGFDIDGIETEEKKSRLGNQKDNSLPSPRK